MWLDANVDLFVVCKKMVLDMMSVEQLLDILSVCYEHVQQNCAQKLGTLSWSAALLDMRCCVLS